MSHFTSQQRKYFYLAGIIVLMIPVIWLGRPGARAVAGSAQTSDVGGKLAQLRAEYDLGENSLGNVDPSSAAVNLVLLGLRGPAVCLLWLEMDHQKDIHDWAAMRATTESIIMLQPHYQKVWQYNGWNLAYNVSVEWDNVKDRYYWVKEGTKFYMKGAARNYKYPELYWYTGDTLGKKIGRADEWKQFRRFFRMDPDTERFTVNGEPGPDRELNPNNEDNYQVSHEWFARTNAVMDQYNKEQHIMDRSLIRSYPGRSLIDLAMIRQKEGFFDETTRKTWNDAYDYWTKVYGLERMKVVGGAYEIQLNWTKEEIEKYTTEEGKDREFALQLRNWVGKYQDMTNYRYWHNRCLAEREPELVAAHRELYESQKLLAGGDAVKAQELALSGLIKFEQQLKNFGDMRADDETIEEALSGIITYRNARELSEGAGLPDKFPLMDLWIKEQGRIPEVETRLRRQTY